MHKRTPNKLLKRKIRRIIQHSSHYDKHKGETIFTATQSEIISQIKEPIDVHLVPDLQKGEVLLDLQGKGSLQQQ